MLRLSNAFFNRSLLSLRTGGKIGIAISPVINPDNLKIEGWYAQGNSKKGESIVLSSEIRDFITKGLVVDDYDALTEPEDLIRLKSTINLRYELTGKTVASENKKRLGRVSDFAVDDDFYIQKLYVNPTLFKGITSEQLLIHRTSILEITDKKIIVEDPTIKVGSRSPARA
jgi:sporulation protein YlmC with PRC-barrel domain